MPPDKRVEPGKKWAIALAVLVHLVFVGVLVFGVNWQTREASPVVAELWSSLSAPAAKPVSKPEPEVKPEPKIEPRPEPKPVPKPEPKPLPKPEPKVEQPKPINPEIALKAKELEKEKKREEEEKKKAEKNALKQMEAKRQENEKLKQERALQEQQREIARQQQEAADALASQRAAAQSRMESDYKGRIRDKIKRAIIVPPDVPGNPQAEFDVTLMPTGEVLNAKLIRSSGNAAYDNAVERAIYKAQPLPLPPDASLFSRFRELQLKFRLNE